jgi:hypothetical protein
MKRADLWGWTFGPVEVVFYRRRLVTLALTIGRHTYRPIDR